jgi:hypothetical protein
MFLCKPLKRQQKLEIECRACNAKVDVSPDSILMAYDAGDDKYAASNQILSLKPLNALLEN